MQLNRTFLAALLAALLCIIEPALAGESGSSEKSGTDFETALGEAGWSVAKGMDGSLILRSSDEKGKGEQSDSPGLEPLAQKLRQSGWQVEENEAGQLLIHPQVPETAEPTQATSPEQSMGALQQRLEAAGWRTRQTVDGTLILLPTPEEAPAAKPSAAPQAGATTLSPEMIERLKAAGWTVREAGDGSLLLFPGPPSPGATEQERIPAQDIERLRERLEASGWSTRRATDGSLLAYPAGKQLPETPPERPTLPLDQEALKRLETAGWTPVQAADGSLLLFPPPAAPTTSPSTRPQEKPVMPSLQQQLEAAGWATHQAEDGSMLLYPPALPRMERDASEPDLSGEFLDATMQERLREAGWTVEEESDGALLLYPPGSEPTVLKPCKGTTTEAAVELPVDSWDEASRIAESWLAEQPLQNAVVGRIRRVLRVHLVSIVTASAPHRLLHQIAIRNRDGAVLMLD